MVQMINKQTLLEVVLENRTEVMGHSVLHRDVNLPDFERQVLVGVRRSGKSYVLYGLIQQLLSQGTPWEEIIYLNFEDERLIGMDIHDLNSILEIQCQMSSQRPRLFLDEVQNISGWEKFARRLADNKYPVFITGSNSKMLSKEIGSTLGARYLTTEIFPLSFEDYLRINKLDTKDPYL